MRDWVNGGSEGDLKVCVGVAESVRVCVREITPLYLMSAAGSVCLIECVSVRVCRVCVGGGGEGGSFGCL